MISTCNKCINLEVLSLDSITSCYILVICLQIILALTDNFEMSLWHCHERLAETSGMSCLRALLKSAVAFTRQAVIWWNTSQYIQLYWEKSSYKSTYRSKRTRRCRLYYGYWDYGCLIEAPRCFSVKEGNSTNTCIHAFFITFLQTPWTSRNSVLNYYAQYPSALLLRLI